MKYKIVTTQPQIYDSFLTTGLIARGISRKIIDIELFNLHDFAFDKHQSIDDSPYGGGAGMVLRVDVMANALDKLRAKSKKPKVILLTPQGKKFVQKDAQRLAQEKEIILIAGRFEGYDERIRDLVDEEISIGDYVLTSGDVPSMVMIESISRNISGFIEKSKSVEEESFSELEIENCKLMNCLEYPQYTRPEIFDGKKIPEILLSGNHPEIKKWRRKMSLQKTKERRPDLI